MSGIRGIAKNFSAFMSSHAIALLQQVALVALFIRTYGRAGYGEWLALSAAVSYLGTLDFGVQTFVNQDLTMRYMRGDMEGFHISQSTALRLLLSIVLVAAAVASSAFVLPLQHMLNMEGVHGDPVVPARVVQTAVFFLALQPLTGIIYGYFGGTFMVLGKSYIGAYWNNAKNLTLIATAYVAVSRHSSFSTIAIAQYCGMVCCLLLEMFHLYKLGPHIFPTLRLWDGTLVPKILKQSGYFALIFSSNFLVYQVPILILQKTAGGSLVALFSIMRTIFSMTRLMLNSPTQSMGPEVTSLFAINDWKGLSRLYDYSERLIFSIIPIVNLGVLYLCPFLLQVWLKQPLLFVPHVYLLGAAASIVMSTKEHKFQFQFSTNTHRELARFMFGSYIFLGVLWAIFIPRFGIQGLMVCWLSIEMCQLSYLIWLNAQLFRHHEVLDKKYLIRLALLSLAFLAGGYVLLPYTRFLPLPRQVVIAVANCVLLLGLAIPLFHLIPVWGKVQERLRRRFA